jgi:site-specific DNA-methyltransferase (adenine-specific)
MKNDQIPMYETAQYTSKRQNWKTPVDLYEKLDKEFDFNFDPCIADEAGFENNGLTIEWGTRSFVNPPYNQLKAWCKKTLVESNKGKLVVMLIPSRTDTTYWHDYVMRADEIRFIKGRLKFQGAIHNAPFPSAIVIFRPGKRKELINDLFKEEKQ